MIFVTQRPSAHKLASSVLEASVTDFLGAATASTGFTHGLVAGDTIYIQSNVEAYNGFKFIINYNPTQFTFGDTADTQIDYYQDATISYQVSVLDHGFVAVHNPIVYELYSNLYPTNSVGEIYYPATVISQANDNGYTKLTLSGNVLNLSETEAPALSWITVGNHGPYQIITRISDSIVVINLAYDANNSFDGPVIKFFNNYAINVNVWVGYDATHPWYSTKPYTLAATLQFTPGDGGLVKFSISEIIQSFITTRNRLDLNTLPNNMDFSAGFYIEYFETYDQSSGTEISTFTGELMSDLDEFEGVAINAKMPFKSLDAGGMSEYIDYDVYLAKWLLLQDSLVWIAGKFFDISFLNQYNDNLVIKVNGENYSTLTDPGIGVIRAMLQFDEGGEYCVQAFKAANAGSPASTTNLSSSITAAPTGFSNTGPGTIPWVLDIQPNADFGTAGSPASPARSKYLAYDYAFISGQNYTLTLHLGIAYTGTNSNPRSAILDILDSSNTVQFHSQVTAPAISGNFSITITFTANATSTRFGVYGLSGGGGFTGTRSLLYDSAELYLNVPEVLPTLEVAITEIICVTVVDECDTTLMPDMDNIRLLEDGDFRILE